jgi:hypothetical protein
VSVLHDALSLHSESIGVSLQPVVALHVATVHDLPSTSHIALSVWCTQPSAPAPAALGSHASFVHPMLSPHAALSGVATQPVVASAPVAPGEHAFVVHENVSVHAASFSVCVQPVTGSAPAAVGSHASAEQLALSSHIACVGVCVTSPVAVLHASTVQAIESSIAFGSCSHWRDALHVSVVQASPSSQSTALTQPDGVSTPPSAGGPLPSLSPHAPRIRNARVRERLTSVLVIRGYSMK